MVLKSLEEILAEIIFEDEFAVLESASKKIVFTGCCTNNYTGYGG